MSYSEATFFMFVFVGVSGRAKRALKLFGGTIRLLRGLCTLGSYFLRELAY